MGESHSANLISTFDHTGSFTSSALIVAKEIRYMPNTRNKLEKILQTK